MKKNIIASLVLSSLVYTGTAFAAPDYTENFTRLATLITVDWEDQSFDGNDVLYVNTSVLNESSLEELKDAYEAGKAILLDSTTNSDKSDAANASKTISGLGIYARMIFIYKDPKTGSPNYSLMNTRLKKAYNKALEGYKSAQEAASISSRSLRSIAGITSESDSAPIYSYTVNSYTGFNCMLKSKLKHYTLIDKKNTCKDGGLIDLVYKIDIFRSIAVDSADVSTEDKKYVRISVSENMGGTGIHLVDDLKETKTWKQTHAYQDFFYGPFVEKYIFSIVPQDTGVDLLGHMPSQVNPQMTKTFSNTLSIGFDVGAAGGTGGLVGVGVNGTYSHTESITVETNEYTIKNASKGNKAAWVWDVKYEENKCSWLRKRDFGRSCYFTTSFFDFSNAVLEKEPLSPMAYKNFVPSFSATYQAEPSKTNESQFDLIARVDYMGIGTKLLPTFPAITGKIKDTSRNRAFAKTPIFIDWSHPYFAAEPTYTLQSLDHNNLCVERVGEIELNKELHLHECTERRYEQFWGYSAKDKQIVSRGLESELCLEDINDGVSNQALLTECSANLTQVWNVLDDGTIQNQFTNNYFSIKEFTDPALQPLLSLTTNATEASRFTVQKIDNLF